MSSDPTAAAPASPAAVASNPNALDWAPFTRFALVAAVAGVALYAVVGVVNLNAAHDDHERHLAGARFMSAYLTGFTYWLSLPIGAMALLMIGYLAKTSWGLLLRRPLEAATRTMPLLAVLFAGLAGAVATHAYSPYWWTNPEVVPPDPAVNMANPAADAEAGNKRDLAIEYGKYMIAKATAHQQHAREEGTYGFLSVPAFIGTGAVLFTVWGLMIAYLNRWSRRAEGTPVQVEAALLKLSNFSGPGMIVYAITLTAAATQWVMSVEPGWSSTMFPVIFAVNQFLTTMALCLALFLCIVSREPFAKVMRPKFQLDMATLLLVFTLFWTYTSFSQFMLIWVGNLPEEIPFYLKRSSGGWWYVSAGLAALHFALPFLLLLFRDIKLHPKRLRAVAVFLLVMCAIDVTWWLAPASVPFGGVPTWLMDAGAILAVGGVWGLYFFHELKKRNILPVDETFLLPEGHHHESH
ncbi:Uncharacterized protein OS=Chloracidobacterium thermophilum (strain B) GN=Cabther_B0237 PE=4 SV=1 [Gemmataceae bacterium]|nr:Uncharacterized protein OS=Chloracidobacterium thermophilum (strain B) GN=Cabther_B0237 PE=4 SV=1 [Gemmataceae bacterium]VTT96954.1 Uncharacterized protein OS=Chloracidobacterium thermophilum (strain B) GN=Cabther_B0237 PE=4 SV=1 [Gemmataceae bacterium]